MVRKMRWIVGLVLVVGLLAGGAETARASAVDHGGYAATGHDRVIIGYRWVQQPYQAWVTKYRSCGTPYRVLVTKYRAVKVPVYGARGCW